MKAVILCGGLGTRLGDLTKNTPKPLIEINGKSVLKTIVDRLKQAGITQIIVKTHYLPEKIIKEMGEEVLYYYEPILFNANETLHQMRHWLAGEDFMVINGDTLSNVDFKAIQDFHQDKTITVLMDDWRAAGVWIYCAEWFDTELPVRPYRQQGLKWQDIGTPAKLEKAREAFV